MNKNHQSLHKNESTVSAAAHALQRKSSARVLSDNRNADPVQMKTTINYSGQNYTYAKNKTQMVGKLMEAHLDPAEPIRGQSANVNKSQDTMMQAIRDNWGIKGGNLVKGHLLNDNLGGNALSYNLYPISKPANSAHLGYVENLAKQELWKHGHGLYYKVAVDGKPNVNTATSAFKCELKVWNPKTKKYGEQLLKLNVNSDLNDVKSKDAYHDVYDVYSSDPDRYGNPLKPKGFKEPTKSVGNLSDTEKQYRDKDNANTLSSDMQWWAG